MALREAKLAKFGRVLGSHVCWETGAGAVVLDHQDGSTVACYFLPRSHRRPFKLEDLMSAHDRMAVPGRIREVLAAEYVLRVAPHDLRVGDVLVARTLGVLIHFYRVVGVPDRRSVSVAPIPDHPFGTASSWSTDEVVPNLEAPPNPGRPQGLVEAHGVHEPPQPVHRLDDGQPLHAALGVDAAGEGRGVDVPLLGGSGLLLRLLAERPGVEGGEPRALDGVVCRRGRGTTFWLANGLDGPGTGPVGTRVRDMLATTWVETHRRASRRSVRISISSPRLRHACPKRPCQQEVSATSGPKA